MLTESSQILNTKLKKSQVQSNGKSCPSYLCVLLLSGIDNGCAADFGELAALSIKGPATDLITDHVLQEENTAVVAQGQFLKQLNVLQEVVI